jgi:hypothetical protein
MHRRREMQRYANRGGDSGVVGYDLGAGHIVAYFSDRRKYTYTDRSAGSTCVAGMQRLAQAGQGLNAYIKHARQARVREQGSLVTGSLALSSLSADLEGMSLEEELKRLASQEIDDLFLKHLRDRAFQRTDC